MKNLTLTISLFLLLLLLLLLDEQVIHEIVHDLSKETSSRIID
jgi:hypothetical protein